MKTRWFKMAVVLIAVSLVGSASADNVWNGAAADGMWGNAGNWSLGLVPATGQGNIIFNNQTTGSLITIDSATSSTVDGDIFGPEWGMDLDIDGGSLTQLSPGFVFAPIADAGNHGVINVKNGGSMEVQELLLGDNWWFGGHPYIDLNVYDTSTVKARGWCWLGGTINLYGGTVDIGGSMNFFTANGYAGINIENGTLIIRDSVFTAAIAQGWEDGGFLKGFGGTGDVIINDSTGDVVITAVIPEPATLSLLGLGVVALLRKRK